MRFAHLLLTAAAATLAVAAIAQQKVSDTYDFKPGDQISLGPNKYPAGGVYRIESCDSVTKPYRECQVTLIAP